MVKGRLQAASTSFMCKKCQGETSPSVMADEGLVVDGEKYHVVDSFCYLGDRLSSSRHTAEDLAEHSVCRHAYAESHLIYVLNPLRAFRTYSRYSPLRPTYIIV